MTEQNLTEVKMPQKRRRNWAKIGILFSMLGFVIFICIFGYGFFQLSKVNISLAEMIEDIQIQVSKNQTVTADIEKSIHELQQAVKSSQELSKQQEQIITEWHSAEKGDLNKWHVAEAQYLVKLANDHLQFTHDTSIAAVFLNQAEAILKNITDANLLEIQKSLTTDIANLQATPHLDVTTVYLRLNALSHQLDQLPLPSTPLKADTNQAQANVQKTLPWWKIGLENSWQALRQIIIVRYNASNALPLVMPDEKTFLYQNLHAQIENAMWAILHRNPVVYQSSLDSTMNWIQQFFDLNESITKNVLQNLQELRKINIEPPITNVSATLQLFDHYFAQMTQAKVAQ